MLSGGGERQLEGDATPAMGALRLSIGARSFGVGTNPRVKSRRNAATGCDNWRLTEDDDARRMAAGGGLRARARARDVRRERQLAPSSYTTLGGITRTRKPTRTAKADAVAGDAACGQAGLANYEPA